MFAEIYPLVKLPRRFRFFDYSLPQEHALNVGDLVRITMKGRPLLGVIRRLKAETEFANVRQIDALIASRFLSKEDIKRFEKIADVLCQSVSNLLDAALPETFDPNFPPFITPTITPRFPTALVPVISDYLTELEQKSSVTIADSPEVAYGLTQTLRRKTQGQMLVLVPRERDAQLIAERIQFGDRAAVLTGRSNKRNRARIIESWRNGSLHTLIGTRQAALLPVKALQVVTVLEAGNDEYLNERRNPRFDAREAIKLLAAQHSAKTIWIDPLPRLEEAVEGLLCRPITEEAASVLSLRSKEEQTTELLLTESVILEIKKALQSQKKVLLFLNRKGVAKRLQCAACGHIPLCGTCGQVPTVRTDDLVCVHCQTEMWIPTNCPSCGKAKIAFRGVGGAKVEESLKKLFPEVTVGRVEKEHVDTSAQIILATEYYFAMIATPFMSREFGLVVDLMTDIGLHANDFRAPENTARKMQRLLHFGQQQGAQVVFQTWLPEVVSGLLHINAWVPQELALRKQYQLPPYRARYLLNDVEVEQLLPDTFPERSKVIIDGPYA